MDGWLCAQDTLDTEADHDKYLYDMSDFVRENIPDKADKGFRPPVPADLADPELLIENCLTIDARCTGEIPSKTACYLSAMHCISGQ
jgi:hypothetical protein